MPLLVILDFLSALLPKKIALQNFLYNLCVWESSNRTQHLRMSSNHKGSVSTQRYLMLVKLQGVFGSPSFRKIRFTIHIQVQMTTRCNWSFLQTVQRGCSAFNAVGANSTLNKFIWNFPSSCTLTLNQHSATAFAFLLSQNTLTSCVPYICKCQCWRRCHVNGTSKIQVGVCRPWSRWTQ